MKTEFYLKLKYDLHGNLPVYKDTVFVWSYAKRDEDVVDFVEKYEVTYIDSDHTQARSVFVVYFSSLQKMMEFQLQYL